MAKRRITGEVSEFASIHEFLDCPTVPEGLITIMDNGIPIDLKYVDRGKGITVLTFHPAINSKVTHIPMFIGGNITQDLEANILFVSDPTMNVFEELETGYFAGSSRQPNLQSDLNKIFRKITEGKRAIYFGFSAGGFAALYFSSLHPGSIAIPVNPQTTLSLHTSERLTKWAEVAWGISNQKDAPVKNVPPVDSDMCDLYSTPKPNRVAYVQNVGDRDHMEIHWARFKKLAKSQVIAGTCLVYAGDGHIAPRPEFLTEVLNTVISSPSWGRLSFRHIKTSPRR